MTKIILGEYYRLKGVDVAWAKPIKMIPPHKGVNTHGYPIYECEWVTNKGDSFGFIKYFRASDLVPSKEESK